MFIKSFSQDVRVGLLLLLKDKSFCFLAVLVLALGICGVTTQFSVVNAIVLRGFSFPHPEQLMSVGLIDPQPTAQKRETTRRELSAVGFYGVMSFAVNQRTQEFGIRMALGADAKRIFRVIMQQGAWQLVIGLVVGTRAAALLLGVVAAGALQNILFKVNALDPSIYFAVAGLLTVVAAASCFVPARRATRVDPIVSLRYE